MPQENFVTVTITSGSSLSAAVNLMDGRLFAIVMPAAWTAADLTFQACATNGGTYLNVYDEDDAEVDVQADASRFIILEPARWLGVRNLKVRSGTAGTPVNQGADRTITLVTIQD